MGLPEFVGDQCDACEKCVAVCPGLAITLVDFRKSDEYATVTIPYEFTAKSIKKGDIVTVLDTEGAILGNVEVTRVREGEGDGPLRARAREGAARHRHADRRHPRAAAMGHRAVRQPWSRSLDDDMIVCRCERVTAGEIRQLIRGGVRDMNELKAITRAGMGACGGKTCPSLILRLFREEGSPTAQITDLTQTAARSWRCRSAPSPAWRAAGSRRRRAAPACDRRARRRPVMSTETYDVVVIGAGSVGLPTAVFLAEQGIKPLVIDQFASAGSGQQQGRHRRHPRHAFDAGQDPPLPRVAAGLLDLEGDLRRRHRVGAGRLHLRRLPRRRRAGA